MQSNEPYRLQRGDIVVHKDRIGKGFGIVWEVWGERAFVKSGPFLAWYDVADLFQVVPAYDLFGPLADEIKT
jgi:hypothetical protein